MLLAASVITATTIGVHTAAANDVGETTASAEFVDGDDAVQVDGALNASSAALRRVFEHLDRGDLRFVVLGDSFAANLRARVFPTILQRWPLPRLTAVAAGGTPASQFWTMRPMIDGVERIEGGPGYSILRQSPGDHFFGLPVRGLSEVHFGPGVAVGPDRVILEHELTNPTFAQVGGTRFSEAGDTLRYRHLYWSPPTDTIALPIEKAVLADAGEARLTFNPSTDARPLTLDITPGSPAEAKAIATPGQINAVWQDIDASNGAGDRCTIQIRVGPDQDATGRYLHTAGGVWYHTDGVGGDRLPGLYYSVLADNSWSYIGYGSDRPSVGDKVFSREQFRHWLDATTLDLDQPVIFTHYLAAEGQLADRARELFEAMIDQAELAATEVGISTVVHWIIIPHAHTIGTVMTEAGVRERFDAKRDAAFAIAQDRTNVAATSLYHATGEVFFDGRPAANDWLIANGYDAMEITETETADLTGDPWFGDLLDATDLHPRDQVSAVAFADMLWDAIEDDRCPADLAEPADVLDFFDISTFLNRLGNQDLTTDLNGDGLWDFFDVTSYLAAFSQGCPT